MKNKLLRVLLVFGIVNATFAQQDMMISQYMFNGLFVNPAYAGSHDWTEVTALYRQQWVRFEGAPVSQILSAEGKIAGKNAGWGAILTNDKIGVSFKTDAYGNYAYHMRVSDEGRISLGVRAGLSYYNANLTQLTVWDQNDQVFASNIRNKLMPNAGMGVYYYTRKFFAGLSVPNVLSYDPATFMTLGNVMTGNENYRRHFYANAGYVFEVNENLHIKPSCLVKYVEGAPVQADLNLNVLFCKNFWIGGSYRSNDGIVTLLEYQHNNNWRLGYAFDYPLTTMRNYSFGSHEIMFAYMFRKKEGLIIKSPRFF
jgi:type IX secretion system PorP/SprF family membrane protein